MVCEWFQALSVTVNEPVLSPVAVGLKVTVTVHFVPGAMLVQLLPGLAVKSPEVVVMLAIFSAADALVGFVITTGIPLLVEPRPTLPKLAMRGAN